MSTKTGKVTQTTASGSGSSCKVDFPGPPPTSYLWVDPPDRAWDVLSGAKTSGCDVEITFDDTTTPPTATAAKSL